MAGRVAPVPPFVDLPSLSRPQVVDEAGFELTDEQVEALATAVTSGEPEPQDEEGEEEEEEVEEGEEELEDGEEGIHAEVVLAEGDVPDDDRQPLLSLDQR